MNYKILKKSICSRVVTTGSAAPAQARKLQDELCQIGLLCRPAKKPPRKAEVDTLIGQRVIKQTQSHQQDNV